MQVTHKADHITHAVIGGQAAQSFGINDSPEFFRILSSSLYSDKKLAVIREIACNAWDAHVEFGKMDVPIEFILTKDSLVIKDHGPGISPGDVQRNYTTYGGTTKIANDNLTGGFGLGSKAPFAYVDHFEMTTCHKGKKHIYRMSLSSAEVNGRPSVTKIMDAPCGDESGVTVSLDLVGDQDYRDFENIIRRVVRNGEMNATLNGQKITTLPFSSAPNDFIILPTHQASENASQILLRYGHVIYPIERDNKFAQVYNSAVGFLNRISNPKNSWAATGKWALVLYAKPGEVSVTPSRETLSMTDQTIATINRLLENFMSSIKPEEIDAHCMDILKDAVATAYADGVPGELCSTQKMMPNPKYFDAKRKDLPQAIYDTKGLAWHFMCGEAYPDRNAFYMEDLKIRVQTMIDQGFGDKTLNKRYLQELQRRGKPDARSDFFQRRVLWPLIRDLKKAEADVSNPHAVKLKNMLAIFFGVKSRGYSSTHFMLPLTGIVSPKIAGVLPFLRRFVLLSHNRLEILEDGFSLPELKTYWGSLRDSLCYIVPRHPAKVKEAKAFFEKRGFTVLDITPGQAIEKDPNPKPRAAPKPKRKGVPVLKTFINPEGSDNDENFDVYYGYYRDDNELIEKPEAVTMISGTRINVKHFQNTSEEAFAAIIRLFGSKVGVVPSRQSYDKLIETGAKPLDLYVKEQLAEQFVNSKTIEAFYRNLRPADYHQSDTLDAVFRVLRRDDKLRKQFKLPPKLSQHDQDLVTLWESYDLWAHERDPVLKLVYDTKRTWTATPAFEAIQSMVVKNPAFKALHLAWLANLVDHPDQIVREKIKKILLTAMKG